MNLKRRGKVYILYFCQSRILDLLFIRDLGINSKNFEPSDFYSGVFFFVFFFDGKVSPIKL